MSSSKVSSFAVSKSSFANDNQDNDNQEAIFKNLSDINLATFT